MSGQKLVFKGRNINYKTKNDLVRKLNISGIQADNLINNKNIKKLLVNDKGDIQKINVKDKPMILRDFDIKPNYIPNKRLLASHSKIKNVDIYNQIPSDKKVNVNVHINFYFDYSSTKHKAVMLSEKYFDVTPGEILDKVNDSINKYLDNIGPESEVLIDENNITYKIFSMYSDQRLKLVDNKLKRNNPINIYHQFANIDLNNTKDCVRDYFKEKFKRISPNRIDKLGNEDGVSITEILDFCKLYNIKCLVYDINGKLIDRHINVDKNKYSNRLIFVAYNNHLYPVKNKFLKKNNQDIKEVKLIDNSIKAISKLINEQNILPGDLKFNGENFSYVHNNIKYIQNKDYFKCLEILKIWGIDDKIYDNIKLSNIFELLEKLYINENINSFIPDSKKIIKGGFNYKINNYDKSKPIEKIDKNKCYSYSLKVLPFLISCDYRTCSINKDPKKIINHYLYIAKPSQSSILLPNTNVYSGYHLKYCHKEGLKFKLLEELTTSRTTGNLYTKMINDIYTNIKDEKIAKEICNIGIGKFERDTTFNTQFKLNGIYNNIESEMYSGFRIDIDNEHKAVFDIEEVVNNIYNKKPIAIQIKDMARMITYQKMLELNLRDSDIIEVHTDSITYQGKLPKDINSEINGWKKEQVNISDFVNVNIFDQDLTFFDNSINDNELYNCYAGSGKTTYTLNTIIPKLEEKGKSFIVLTPSHAALDEYRIKNENREKKINCKVIQSFNYTTELPSEDYIIVDEIGMVDRQGHDFLFKCHKLGKIIIALGDFNQLPPVDKNKKAEDLQKYNSVQYLNYLFKKHYVFKDNYRNKFSIEYYDMLINNKVNLIEEVKKYNTVNPYDAEVIICYENSTVDIYNKIYMYKNNIKDFDIGEKIICKTNRLQDKEIYKNFVYEIIDNKEDLLLSNGMKITRKQYKNFFKPAYARTLYAVQGKSLKSFHFPTIDFKYLENDGNKVYTLISRLIQK